MVFPMVADVLGSSRSCWGTPCRRGDRRSRPCGQVGPRERGSRTSPRMLRGGELHPHDRRGAAGGRCRPGVLRGRPRQRRSGRTGRRARPALRHRAAGSAGPGRGGTRAAPRARSREDEVRRDHRGRARARRRRPAGRAARLREVQRPSPSSRSRGPSPRDRAPGRADERPPGRPREPHAPGPRLRRGRLGRPRPAVRLGDPVQERRDRGADRARRTYRVAGHDRRRSRARLGPAGAGR